MNQTTALGILKTGKNVFLTGSAGAGKTYVLNQYIKYLKARKVPVAITASTGIASTHINGITIHAWSGIGLKKNITNSDLLNFKDKKYLKDHLENTEVLIIDEISMLHLNQLEMVNTVLKFFKNNMLPFGGIQVIFCGDFFQLPPVGEPGESSREKYAFMSKAWNEAEPLICYLTEQHRQKDNPLNDILNEIRFGNLSEKSIELLRKTARNNIDHLGQFPKLYTHNVDVDQINKIELQKLTSKSKIFQAETKGNIKLLELLKNNVRTDDKLELKIGAKVMFIKNNHEKGYINGSLGTIINFDSDGKPIVEMLDKSKIFCEKESWSIDDEMGKSLASFEQFPLRAAWAITIHKSQGMTLDAAEVDLSNCFEKGQGYVALSRVKSIEGLKLLGFNSNALELDMLATKADKRFQELSEIAEIKFNSASADKEAKDFIRKCGGTLDIIEIEKNLKKLNTKGSNKESKKSTYQLTKELVDKKMSLEDIAKERNFSVGTIIGHLEKIIGLYPETDISRFRPKSTTLKKVEKACLSIVKSGTEKLTDEKGNPNLRPIYDYLGEKVSWNDIKLAMIFAKF
jgi:ATP-dependent exoDNAse (exonuclease V) alpha subunit